MVYTIEEIKEKVKPIAKKYHVKEMYLFGSYARGTATDSSDLDFVVVGNLKRMIPISIDLQETFHLENDVLSEEQMNTMSSPIGRKIKEDFEREKVIVYEE
ncbi:hypothetical protein SAMN02745116_01039 [Pilibacter termitis]|uniref:Polymerase nucleotidyl transferase domain-containing protein n=1 Tax=Pilibacter termitis TaxID=263852 RepID=A0A1T4MBR8_9ENTE|nr:nucleotidyltransferase domain-containing protein [Pilibacter termitis]SJZ64469.1 hypothetical protein SAMN02745116_01039 [Pilibacter termitis]